MEPYRPAVAVDVILHIYAHCAGALVQDGKLRLVIEEAGHLHDTTDTTVTMAAFALYSTPAEVLGPHSHPLFLSPAEDVHPVLDRVPAALPVQDVTQLDLVQVFPQHLHRDMEKH